jgi:hypothetical protein
MYMLNLVFKIDANNPDGLLVADEPTKPKPPLQAPLHWLEWKLDEPADPPNPEDPSLEADYNWNDLGQAATLLLPSNPNPGWICIRAVNDPDGSVPDTLQLVVAFGRPARAFQPQASPFTDVNGHIVTTFVKEPVPTVRNTSRAWFYSLGQIANAKRPGHPKLTHRYEFAVGLIVTARGKTYYYGEDPEMDIGK